MNAQNPSSYVRWEDLAESVKNRQMILFRTEWQLLREWETATDLLLHKSWQDDNRIQDKTEGRKRQQQ